MVRSCEGAAETFSNVKRRRGNPEKHTSSCLPFVHSLIIHAITYKYTAHITQNNVSGKIVLLTLWKETLGRNWSELYVTLVYKCVTHWLLKTLRQFVTVTPQLTGRGYSWQVLSSVNLIYWPKNNEWILWTCTVCVSEPDISDTTGHHVYFVPLSCCSSSQVETWIHNHWTFFNMFLKSRGFIKYSQYFLGFVIHT